MNAVHQMLCISRSARGFLNSGTVCVKLSQIGSRASDKQSQTKMCVIVGMVRLKEFPELSGLCFVNAEMFFVIFSKRRNRLVCHGYSIDDLC